MLAAVVFETGGSLEYNLVLGFDGNLLACLRIDALTFSLLLDVETAKVGNGHLLLFFSETICYYTENGIYGFCCICFCATCALCYGSDKFCSVHIGIWVKVSGTGLFSVLIVQK